MKNIFLLLVIVFSFLVRIYGINWDGGYHLHPDERMITMVAGGIHFPKGQELSTIFTPESPLNPKFFAYGSFPIYLLKIASNLLSLVRPQFSSYDYLNLIGRFISAVFDVGTVFLIYLLGKKLWREKVGLLAAFLYGFSVFPIQASHFYAVDVILTFFILLTLYFLVVFIYEKKRKNLLNIGVAFGFALATKVSSILLLAPVAIAVFLFTLQDDKKLFLKILTFIKLITFIILISFLTFAVLEPYVLIDFPTFWRQTQEQSRMTKDAFTFPYTLQYVGTTPYLYHLKNMVLWGMGIPLGILSILGSLMVTFLVIKQFFSRIQGAKFHKETFFALLVLLSFFWVYFAVTGRFAIKFMRYFLPLYPLFILFGTKLIVNLRIRIIRLIGLIGVIGWGVIYSLSFLSIYSKETTRISASKWINTNIPAGSTLAREHWDDGLPLFGGENYKFEELKLYEPDSPQKWQEIDQQLEKVDYIIIASNRLYVPLQKLESCNKFPGHCYPKTSKYYRDLFSGMLPFKKVAEFSSYPTIPFFNISLVDDGADESFTVYDHPKIIIFKKRGL